VSKRLWPSLPTGIGSPPRYLSGGAPWKSLDFASAQYHAKRGDFENWLREEVALAKKAHLKLVLSLNVLHGGDTRRRDQPMSAEQLERYGTLCVQEPTAMALLMWKWDAAYFAQPKIRQALQTIANAASERLPQLQPSSTPASPAAKIENFQLTGERWTCTADGKPLIGLLLKPEGRGPFPAIVLSHARGVRVENAVRSKGRDFVKWGFVGIATDYTHKGGTTDPGFTFGARPENIRRALACLEIVRQQEDVDPRRIAAYGHSMGAFVTIALAAAAPDKIAAAAITAGGVHPQAVRPSPTPDVAEKVRAPFLILHGAADKVVSPKDSELFKQVLDKNKVPNERHLFEGVSHNLPGERADEVNHLIREWFTKHGVLAKAPPANLPREMPANQK
jgi:dienelactone hydrolase